MRQINWLVIHTAATRPSMDIGKKEIDRWHKERGFNGIGYHYVIRRNGKIERGRPESRIGAHVQGHNHDSIGICLVGGVNENLVPENNYTEAQWSSLEGLLRKLAAKYPEANVRGHRDFPGVSKACPCFDAEPWAAARGFKTASRQRHAVKELKNSRTVAGGVLAAAGMGGSQMNEVAQQVSFIPGIPDWLAITFGVMGMIGILIMIGARIADAIKNPKFSGPVPDSDSLEG